MLPASLAPWQRSSRRLQPRTTQRSAPASPYAPKQGAAGRASMRGGPRESVGDALGTVSSPGGSPLEREGVGTTDGGALDAMERPRINTPVAFVA